MTPTQRANAIKKNVALDVRISQKRNALFSVKQAQTKKNGEFAAKILKIENEMKMLESKKVKI